MESLRTFEVGCSALDSVLISALPDGITELRVKSNGIHDDTLYLEVRLADELRLPNFEGLVYDGEWIDGLGKACRAWDVQCERSWPDFDWCARSSFSRSC